MDFLSMTTALTIVFLFVFSVIGDWIIEKIRNEPAPVTKILFIFTPVAVLGFMGILPANIAWVGGVLIILNSFFNSNKMTVPMESHNIYVVKKIILTIIAILVGIAVIFLVFMDILSINVALIIGLVLIAATIGDWIINRITNKAKIIFIFIPLVVLGFTGVVPANIAWVGGILIILNCLFNKPTPMKPLDYFKNITPEEILKGREISDPTRQKLFGETSLHSAVKYNDNPEVIKALITTGADIHAQANNGSTPLHIAAKYNKNPEIIIALLNAGADCKVKNIMLETPFDLIQKNESLKDTDAYQALKDVSE